LRYVEEHCLVVCVVEGLLLVVEIDGGEHRRDVARLLCLILREEKLEPLEVFVSCALTVHLVGPWSWISKLCCGQTVIDSSESLGCVCGRGLERGKVKLTGFWCAENFGGPIDVG
jgi:hypothetical protein